MNKIKNLKFVSLVAVFCFVVSYFGLLSPTTAYFYESTDNRYDVTFSLLSDSQTISEKAVNFNLKGATKFEDFNEYLFDEVVFEQYITVKNDGEIPARVYVEVDVPTESAENGLQYIVLKTEKAASGEELPETTQSVVASGSQKGELKSLIETQLNTFNASFVEGISQNDAITILNAYNQSQLEYINAPLLEVGESIGFRVLYWAEYGLIENTLKDTSVITKFSYSSTITVNVAQDNEEAAVDITSAS